MRRWLFCSPRFPAHSFVFHCQHTGKLREVRCARQGVRAVLPPALCRRGPNPTFRGCRSAPSAPPCRRPAPPVGPSGACWLCRSRVAFAFPRRLCFLCSVFLLFAPFVPLLFARRWVFASLVAPPSLPLPAARASPCRLLLLPVPLVAPVAPRPGRCPRSRLCCPAFSPSGLVAPGAVALSLPRCSPASLPPWLLAAPGLLWWCPVAPGCRPRLARSFLPPLCSAFLPCPALRALRCWLPALPPWSAPWLPRRPRCGCAFLPRLARAAWCPALCPRLVGVVSVPVRGRSVPSRSRWVFRCSWACRSASARPLSGAAGRSRSSRPPGCSGGSWPLP